MVLLASSYDQSRFLKAADLEREKKFRIKSVTEEEVGEKKEKKLVVWFTNDQRGLVLNKTNNRTIRGAFGDPIEGWIGKIIIIFPTMVDMRGKLTPALRVRIPPPKSVATASAAPKPPGPKPVATATPAPEPAAASGNGGANPPPPQTAATAADPELEDDPVKPLRDELDDEIAF
jgi:hypothetical protein